MKAAQAHWLTTPSSRLMPLTLQSDRVPRASFDLVRAGPSGSRGVRVYSSLVGFGV